MNAMSHHIDDTMLGAYVDGELTADQVRDVEKLLAVDEGARVTVRTIREITELLRAMGWEGLGAVNPGCRLAS
jgi:anti-sigma factor RsiW